MPEMTAAQRRWESWYQAFISVVEAFPEPVEVPCPEGDGGFIRLTYYGLPGSSKGSVTAWCDRCYHGIWLGRVSIPTGAQVYPFEGGPEGRPEIKLIPEA
ncbi:hypothetical protein [Actinoplanes sp. NBRC 103695]|uniref:hypothetical protein n=1 Tax=Actinoplanes sp. NBRC 103695 TaxID=3032202 RepID=UPI0024A463E7|nr:hypothetical protein [Actinoplanes sp. NBRC 103695]GLY98329.1 hypothetical protein Acsp02_55830 [Actinoplanes sp. NBRC 103695]